MGKVIESSPWLVMETTQVAFNSRRWTSSKRYILSRFRPFPRRDFTKILRFITNAYPPPLPIFIFALLNATCNKLANVKRINFEEREFRKSLHEEMKARIYFIIHFSTFEIKKKMKRERLKAIDTGRWKYEPRKRSRGFRGFQARFI